MKKNEPPARLVRMGQTAENGSRQADLLTGVMSDTEPIRLWSALARAEIRPERETVVSVTRPSYGGKTKLQPKRLWSNDLRL